jgi:phage baseplate assembly protein W
MSDETYASFLGSGWSFPPRFANGGVEMSHDERDIAESLAILFGTAQGERFLQPKYGLDMHALMFEPMSTTMSTFLKDRVRTALLIHEPRIRLINLDIANSDPNSGTFSILVEYEVRATNSRYNLVFPFYRTDSNELRAALAPPGSGIK